MTKSVKNFFLFLTAFIWGMAFVAQSVAMDSISPYTFNSIRFIISGGLLFLFCLTSGRYKNINLKALIKAGVICGIVLFSASTLQQLGMVSTGAGKAGFITVFYIVFVPFLSLFTKNRPGIKTWACVGVALYGLYLLCMKGGFSIELSDFYILMCAFMFAVHIMVIDKFGAEFDPITLSSVQFITAAVIGLPFLFVLPVNAADIKEAAVPILYTSVMSTGVGYTFQAVGQKDNDPTSVSLILSLESVFAAVGGFLILHESFSYRELIGCILIFAAITIIQLPDRKKDCVSASQSA